MSDQNEETASLKVTLTSHHDFLFSDRHRRLYPDPFVYIPDPKIPQFLTLLRQGHDADGIQAALELPYRGDVLFARRRMPLQGDGDAARTAQRRPPGAWLGERISASERMVMSGDEPERDSTAPGAGRGSGSSGRR